MSAEVKPRFLQRITRFCLKFFFNLLYHQFAWTYDWVAAIVSLGRWTSWVVCPIPFLDGSKVLELGCGPGHLQLALSRRIIFPCGLDSSKQMVHLAAHRLSSNSQPVNIIHGQSQNIPFSNGSFDKLVATFPNEYIFERETLSHAWRVLKDHGELIILPGAWITGESFWDRFAAWVFRVTGQVPVSDFTQDDDRYFPMTRLHELGFQTSKEIIELQSSKVILIHAVKVVSE